MYKFSFSFCRRISDTLVPLYFYTYFTVCRVWRQETIEVYVGYLKDNSDTHPESPEYCLQPIILLTTTVCKFKVERGKYIVYTVI